MDSSEKFYKVYNIDYDREGGRVIEKLPLSKHAKKILKDNNFKHFSDILSLSENGLYSLSFIDGPFIDEILDYLKSYKSRGYKDKSEKKNPMALRGKKLTRLEILNQLMDKCEIYYEGDRISREIVLIKEREFLLNSLDASKNTKAVFLGTGSELFDAVAFVCVVMISLIMDKSNVETVKQELEEGDKVTYQNKRYVYDGFFTKKKVKKDWSFEYEKDSDGKYFCLIGEQGETRYIPIENINQVSPYNGKSKRLDGMGLGRSVSKRVSFLTEIANLNSVDVAAIAQISAVVYMDLARLRNIINNVALVFDDKSYSITDLVTVSYFTYNNEIPMKGNPQKLEPVIKVTNNIDKARELVYSREGNKVTGFVVLDDEPLKRNSIEFENLLGREKLNYAWLITKNVESKWLCEQIKDNDDAKVLALTSSYLSMIKTRKVEDNTAAERLSEEISREKNKHITAVMLDCGIVWKEYRLIKRKLTYVFKNSDELDIVLQFVNWAYHILKLIDTSIVPLCALEDESEKKLIDEIDDYKNSVVEFPEDLRDYINDIIDYISGRVTEFYNRNPKFDKLKEEYGLSREKKRIAIVLPTTSIAKRSEMILNKMLRHCISEFEVFSIGDALKKNFGQYDALVCTCLQNIDKIIPFDFKCSNIEMYLYDSQIRLYKKVLREHNEYLQLLDSKNGLPIEDEKEQISNIEENEIKEFIDNDNIIAESSMRLFIEGEMRNSHIDSAIKGSNVLEAHLYGHFVSGENIVFSKEYKAYVFDKNEEVIEKAADDLNIGDRLLFTLNNGQTKDIVDSIMDELIVNNSVVKDNIDVVDEWKNALRSHRAFGNLTYGDLKKEFKNAGKEISSQAIRAWIEKDSHIVGPKNADAFVAIGEVTKSQEIIKDPNKYQKATAFIRSTRREILKLIQKAIVADYNKQEIVSDLNLEGILDKIRDITVIKELDQLKEVEPFDVLMYRANRPLED